MNKYHMLLELDKIIEMLQDECILKSNKLQLNNYELMNDFDEINRYLLEVDEALVLMQRMQRFPLYFSNDISILLKKVSKSGVLVEDELLDIGRFLDTIKNISIYVDSLSDAHIPSTFINEYASQLYYPKELNLRIKEIISPYGEILDTASAILRDLRKQIKDCERSIQQKLQEILQKNSSKLSQVIISIRNDRYVIPVKNEYKNTIKGIQHDQSSSKETVFIEPAIINQLNNKLNELKESEKKEIFRILRDISAQIDGYNSELLENYKIICHLDMVYAKAKLSMQLNCNKPQLNREGIVDLYQCRHPLLKVDNVVSNNVSLGSHYKGIIITGPNTGGKTVLLKTLGLLSLMIKLGMLIPCDSNSNIMVFDQVFADIGDEQSIDQNLSTFSSHLKNVIDIMQKVTNQSLVLLDELGSGTDPAEGSALAIAIFDSLIERDCLVVATSHYSELKIHAYQSHKIINASVEFDIQTLQPTYKLLLGIPGQSNALQISRILGLPSNIIDRAEKYAYEKSDHLSMMLEKLTIQSKELDVKLKHLEQRNQDLTKKVEEADLLKLQTVIEQKKLIKQAEEEAQRMIQGTSKKMESILKELDEMKSRSVKLHEVADIKHQIKTLKEDAKIEEPSFSEPKDIKEGDFVYVDHYGSYGTVLKIIRNKKADVQIGIATITVELAQLQIAKNPLTTTKTPFKGFKEKKQVSMTLDLRGERFEEAKVKLEKYIDDVIYGGLLQVSIIHGFGTGVIREMVRDFLKTSPFVESYRYGTGNEGGQGATIVTLKNN